VHGALSLTQQAATEQAQKGEKPTLSGVCFSPFAYHDADFICGVFSSRRIDGVKQTATVAITIAVAEASNTLLVP
jgi:hypothetical protein